MIARLHLWRMARLWLRVWQLQRKLRQLETKQNRMMAEHQQRKEVDDMGYYLDTVRVNELPEGDAQIELRWERKYLFIPASERASVARSLLAQQN